ARRYSLDIFLQPPAPPAPPAQLSLCRPAGPVASRSFSYAAPCPCGAIPSSASPRHRPRPCSPCRRCRHVNVTYPCPAYCACRTGLVGLNLGSGRLRASPSKSISDYKCNASAYLTLITNLDNCSSDCHNLKRLLLTTTR